MHHRFKIISDAQSPRIDERPISSLFKWPNYQTEKGIFVPVGEKLYPAKWIADGGFSRVYRFSYEGEDLVIKFLIPERTPIAVSIARTEARNLLRLQGLGLPVPELRFLYIDEAANHAAIIMTNVGPKPPKKGRPSTPDLFDTRFSPAKVFEIGQQVINVMSDFLAQGLILTDIKPENLVLPDPKDIRSLKIVDLAGVFTVGKTLHLQPIPTDAVTAATELAAYTGLYKRQRPLSAEPTLMVPSIMLTLLDLILQNNPGQWIADALNHNRHVFKQMFISDNDEPDLVLKIGEKLKLDKEKPIPNTGPLANYLNFILKQADHDQNQDWDTLVNVLNFAFQRAYGHDYQFIVPEGLTRYQAVMTAFLNHPAVPQTEWWADFSQLVIEAIGEPENRPPLEELKARLQDLMHHVPHDGKSPEMPIPKPEIPGDSDSENSVLEISTGSDESS